MTGRNWAAKSERAKYKSILIRLSEKEYEKIKEIKDAKGLNWEDFFYYAAINVKVGK